MAQQQQQLEPLHITIRGKPDSGKTTVAQLIFDHLREIGFRTITLADLPPLAPDQKPDYPTRLARNFNRPIHIHVELVK